MPTFALCARSESDHFFPEARANQDCRQKPLWVLNFRDRIRQVGHWVGCLSSARLIHVSAQLDYSFPQ